MSTTPDHAQTVGRPDPLTAETLPLASPAPGERVFAIDIARGVAVPFMIAVHTLWMFGAREVQFESSVGHWVHIAGQGACAFLITMGFSFMVTRDQSLARALQRGVRFGPNKYGVLALAFAAVGIGALMRGTRVGYPVVDYVLDLLWGTEWNVYFPVFPWIANILVGMFLAMVYLEHGRQERALFRAAGLLWPPLLLGGLALTLTDWDYHFNDFFHTGPGGAIYLIGAGLFVFHVGGHLIALPLRNQRWFRVPLTYFSAHVTTLYVVQWTLICWTMGLVGYQTLGTGQVLAMMPVMIAATLVVEWLLRRGIARLRLGRGPATVAPAE